MKNITLDDYSLPASVPDRIRAIPLWNEVKDKVKQKMGESSWQGLMQSWGEFVNVTDELTNQKT
jgi:hypothetical protein